MIKIRKNVFETNSSSSHSLVYTVDSWTGETDKPEITEGISLFDFYGDDPENGILGICFGNYGWNGDPCSTFRTKLSYILTQIVGGYDFTIYRHGKKDIEVKNEKQWDKAINDYVLTNPEVIKVLECVKKHFPEIKGFKFYWYDINERWSIKFDYEHYKYRKNIKNDLEIPEMTDPFWKDYDYGGGSKYMIGFGNIDHQSVGLVNRAVSFLEKYLFDNNLWVVITNDNR